MRAYVEVLTGPTAGQKVVIRPGEMLEFGRTELADVSFEHDQAMSSVHFAVRSTGSECRLRDLGSTNGTYVNDVPVSDTALGDGDVILAGGTELAVYLHDIPENLPVDKTEIRPRPDGDLFAPGRAVAAPVPRALVAYERQQCDSKLSLLRGGGFGQPRQPAAPSQLVGRLTAWSVPYLIVDFSQLKEPTRQVVTEPWPLFDWLPDDAARDGSPLIVTPATCQAWEALIDAAWDQDLMVCFFTSLDLPAMVSHLRAALRFTSRETPEGRPRGMLGYYYPSILSPLLSLGCAGLADRLLDSIQAVVMEVPDCPQTWQIYTRASQVATLAKAGLAEQDLAPREAAAPALEE